MLPLRKDALTGTSTRKRFTTASGPEPRRRFPQSRLPGTSTTKESIQGNPQGRQNLKRCIAHHPGSCIHKERNSKQFQVKEPTNEDNPRRSPNQSAKYEPRRIPRANPNIDASLIILSVLSFTIALSASLHIICNLYFV
jgi:hypothetical protein